MNMPVSIAIPHVADVVDVDGEAAVLLSPLVLARLGVGPGDTLEFVEDGDRMLLRRKGTERPDQMTALREVMQRRRKALAELAK